MANFAPPDWSASSPLKVKLRPLMDRVLVVPAVPLAVMLPLMIYGLLPCWGDHVAELGMVMAALTVMVCAKVTPPLSPSEPLSVSDWEFTAPAPIV